MIEDLPADNTHWSTAAIRRPRLLIMMIALLLVGGLSSWSVLPQMEDPVLTPRAATISTLFPIADAQQVETLITDPIEDAIREVEEIKETRSQSRSGASLITIELRDDVYNPSPIWSRIRGKVEDSIALLPEGASRPEFDPLDVRAFAWIGGLVWKGKSAPNYAIMGRFSKHLEDRIRSISGTDDVELFGRPNEEIIVEFDSAVIANAGLSATEIADSILADDARNATGFLRSGSETLPVEMANQLSTVESIRQLPVKTDGDGRFVVVGDIATVDRVIADPPSEIGQIDGYPALMTGAMVRNQSRIDRWRGKLEIVLEDFRQQLPSTIELETVLDQNVYVQQRLSELLWNLALGSAAVLLVVWILMGWRNAIMVSTALPLVSLAVLTTMRFLGIPVHQMSVAGLIIALGLLIDNAIVIVDSISNQLREGKSVINAVGATGRILAIPLLASTLTTAFSFAPICLMEGPAGEFVGAMAINVITAVASSLLISLVIIAPLAAMLDGFGSKSRAGRERKRTGISPSFLLPLFKKTVRTAIGHPAITTLGCLGLAFAGLFALSTLPDQFFPPAGRDQFHVELELPLNASFNELTELTEKMSDALREHPRVKRTTWLIGRSAPTFYYNIVTRRLQAREYAQAIVQLDSKEDAVGAIREIQQQMQSRFPEARFLARQLEQGPPFNAPVELRFSGPDLDTLRDLGERARRLLSEIPDVVHARIELNDAIPTVQVDVSTAEARMIGMRPGEISQQLNAQLEGARSGFVLQETEQIPVRVRAADGQRNNFEDLSSMDVVLPGRDGEQRLPLNAIAKLSLRPKTAAINRLNTIRVQEVQAFTTAGVLPSKILTELNARIERENFEVPPGYRMSFGGEASKRNEAVGNLMASVGLLMAAMLTTLVLSMGSFRGALIIGMVALMAIGFGGASLFLFGYPFGFMAIVGIMGLIGIAINDSIVVLTALRQDPQAAAGDHDGIVRVTLHETRHVLATTFTTIAGFLPLILAGGGFWPPMAIAIAGGVVGCTLLALIFVPSSFAWFMKKKGAIEVKGDSHEIPAPKFKGAAQQNPALPESNVARESDGHAMA